MTKKPKLKIAHLYPKEMNLYGDTGNRLIIEKRLEWRGIDYEMIEVSVGDDLPDDVDIVIAGGGQDASQGEIEQDFLNRAQILSKLVEDGCVFFVVCGMYQLMGRRFVTFEGQEIKGLGLLPLETIAKKGRIIGNIVVETDFAGDLVGYENHSGRTYLDNESYRLGKVVKGSGNNDKDYSEGCRFKNVFGTYMHGPALAKNPRLADALILLALERKGYDLPLEQLDDELEQLTAQIARKRPR